MGRGREVNREYRDFLEYHHTAAVPTRPVRPKDKGHVEAGVKIRPSLPRRSPIQSDWVAYFPHVAIGPILNRRQQLLDSSEVIGRIYLVRFDH